MNDYCKRNNLAHLLILLVALWVGSAGQLAVATLPVVTDQDGVFDSQAGWKVEMISLQVSVYDTDGRRVKDANICCVGLRTNAEPIDFWHWNSAAYGGQAPKATTDNNGVATIPCPKFASGRQKTELIICRIEHPDFVSTEEELIVTSGNAHVQLEPGFRIALTAQNSVTGDSIISDLYATMGLGGGRWELKKNGLLLSANYPRHDCTLRVMQLVDGQPALFSKRLLIKPGNKRRVFLRNVELAPGVRVAGKLGTSVKRPIKNGFVAGATYIVSGEATWDTCLWFESAPISEDGTFVFESLPPDAVWKMYPFCDDWAPLQPEFRDNAEYFKWNEGQYNDRIKRVMMPRFVKLSEHQDENDVQLEMAPAVTLNVNVLDADRQPVPGVEVQVLPKQANPIGGTSLLGTSDSTRKSLECARRGEKVGPVTSNPFRGKSDAKGTVSVSGLPMNMLVDIKVKSDDFELPQAGRGRLVRHRTGQRRTKSITLQLRQKNSLRSSE